MNRNVLHAAIAVLGLASGAAAQQPTLGATITEDLQAVAQGYSTLSLDWSFVTAGAPSSTWASADFSSPTGTGVTPTQSPARHYALGLTAPSPARVHMGRER